VLGRNGGAIGNEKRKKNWFAAKGLLTSYRKGAILKVSGETEASSTGKQLVDVLPDHVRQIDVCGGAPNPPFGLWCLGVWGDT